MAMALQSLNECINLADMLHANTYSRKLKVTLTVIGWTWSNMSVDHRGSALSQE